MRASISVSAAATTFRMLGNDGGLHLVGGQYREIDPPKRIVLTWRWETSKEGRESIVTVDFIDHGTETEIVLTHEGLVSEQDHQGHRHGWIGCFEKLAATL